MPSEGDRIELVSTTDPHTELQPGDRGWITGIAIDLPPIAPTVERKYWIEWDNGSTLAMIEGTDSIRVIDDE